MADELGDRSLNDNLDKAVARPEPAGGDGPAKVSRDIFSQEPDQPRLHRAFNDAAQPKEEKQGEDTDTGGGKKTGGDNATALDMEPGGPSRPRPSGPSP